MLKCPEQTWHNKKKLYQRVWLYSDVKLSRVAPPTSKSHWSKTLLYISAQLNYVFFMLICQIKPNHVRIDPNRVDSKKNLWQDKRTLSFGWFLFLRLMITPPIVKSDWSKSHFTSHQISSDWLVILHRHTNQRFSKGETLIQMTKI